MSETRAERVRQDAGSGEAAGSCAVTSCSVYESVMSTLSMPDGVDISLQRVSESGGDARTGEGRGRDVLVRPQHEVVETRQCFWE